MTVDTGKAELVPFDTLVRQQIAERPEMGSGFLRLAVEDFVLGDLDGMRSGLRLLINATIGFPALAKEAGIGEKSLMRMLGKRGNPTAANLSAILAVLNQREKAFVPPSLDEDDDEPRRAAM